MLLTNDDGIDAPGLASLVHAVREAPWCDRWDVVAPAQVQSAMSHSVTLHRALAIERRELPWGEGWAVAGRPADCVKLAAAGVLPGLKEVDLVLSGVNAGANVGINVTYSGTVAAAREAGFVGLPGIALSLHLKSREPDWAACTRHVAEVLAVLIDGPLGRGVLNVNLPVLDGPDPPRDLCVVPVSDAALVTDYTDDDGSGFRIKHAMAFQRYDKDTDVGALFDRHITVTPLHADPTCRRSLPAWQEALRARDGTA